MSTGFLFRSVEQDKCGSDGLVVRHCCCFDGEKASATLDVQGKRRTSLFGCLPTVSAISYCIVWSVGGAVRRDCLFAVSWQLQSSSMTFLKTLTWLFPPSSSILSLSLSLSRSNAFLLSLLHNYFLIPYSVYCSSSNGRRRRRNWGFNKNPTFFAIKKKKNNASNKVQSISFPRVLQSNRIE